MDWTPHINWLAPEEERDEASHISTQLFMLKHLENQFRSAEKLMPHAEGWWAYLRESGAPQSEQTTALDWTQIAAHYAVLSIYHFRDALHSIRDRLGHTPKLKSKISTKALQDAVDRFEQEFPQAIELRDHVCHFIDKVFSPAKIEANTPTDGTFFHGTMQLRRLVFTYKGRTIAQAVTEDEAEKLRSLRLEVYEVFRTAEERHREG